MPTRLSIEPAGDPGLSRSILALQTAPPALELGANKVLHSSSGSAMVPQHSSYPSGLPNNYIWFLVFEFVVTGAFKKSGLNRGSILDQG